MRVGFRLSFYSRYHEGRAFKSEYWDCYSVVNAKSCLTIQTFFFYVYFQPNNKKLKRKALNRKTKYLHFPLHTFVLSNYILHISPSVLKTPRTKDAIRKKEKNAL